MEAVQNAGCYATKEIRDTDDRVVFKLSRGQSSGFISLVVLALELGFSGSGEGLSVLCYMTWFVAGFR